MAKATEVSLWSDLECNQGARIASVPDVIDMAWAEAPADDRGTLVMHLPFDSPAAADCAIYNVIRVDDWDSNGVLLTWEYYISGLKDKVNDAILEVTASPVINILNRALVTQLIGGLPVSSVAFSLLTPAQIIANYMIPALGSAGYGFFVLGNIVPTYQLSNTFTQQTALQVGAWLEQQTNYEMYLTRVSNLGYAINLGQMGSGAKEPAYWVGRNIQALDRDIQGNDKFFNRVFPTGVTASSETDPTNCGEAAWSQSAIDGNNITIEDPEQRVNPILSDGQLNGRYAMAVIDTPVVPWITYPYETAWDPIRRTLWFTAGTWVTPAGTSGAGIGWYDTRDNTYGYLTGFTGGLSYNNNIVYVPSTDRIYFYTVQSANPFAYVGIVNPETKTIVNSITSPGTPGRLNYQADADRVLLSVYNAFEEGVVVINPQTETKLYTAVVGSTSSSNPTCLDKASNRLFAVDSTHSVLKWFNATTGALISSMAASSIQGMACYNGTIYIMGAASQIAMVNPAAPAALSWITFPQFNGLTWSFGANFNMYFVAGAVYIFVYNANTNFIAGLKADRSMNTASWTGELADAGWSPNYRGFCYDPTYDAFIRMVDQGGAGGNGAAIMAVRRSTMSSVEGFTVQDTVAATQTIVKSTTDIGFFQQAARPRWEFRGSSGLERVVHVDDAASVAAYGAVDSPVVTTLNGKRNYARPATWDDWRPDNTSPWIGLPWVAPTTYGVREQRWEGADLSIPSYITGYAGLAYTAGAASFALYGVTPSSTYAVGDIISTSAAPTQATSMRISAAATADTQGHVTLAVDSGSMGSVNPGTTIYVFRKSQSVTVGTGGYTTGGLTIPLAGLYANQVLSPGDVVMIGATKVRVRIRTVADATGAATVPVGTGLPTSAAGVAVTIWQPQRLPNSRPCAVVFSPYSGANAPNWFSAFVVPVLPSQTTLWVTVHLQMSLDTAYPNSTSVKFLVNGSAVATVTPTDATNKTNSLQDITVSQKITLPAGLGSAIIGILGMNAVVGTIYIQSIKAAFSADVDITDVPSGDGNIIWAIGTTILSKGREPTIVYDVKLVDDDPDRPAVAGASCLLRDPIRGITAHPRVARLTRFLRRSADIVREIEMTLSTDPNSVAREIVALEQGALSGGIAQYNTKVTPKGTLSSLTLDVDSVTLAQGGTHTFSVTATDFQGNSVPVNPTYQVLNGGGTITAAGVFTAGTTAGSFVNTIRVTAGGLTAYATVVVSVGAAASLSISPSSGNVGINGTIAFSASVLDSAGNVVTKSVAWSIAAGGGTINATTGLFTAGAAAGTFTNTVKATYGALTAYATVVVASGAGTLARIAVTPSPVSLSPGGTQQMVATGYDANNNVVALGAVTWATGSVPNSGSIDASGKYTASTVAGTYPGVIVAVSGGVSGTADVTVNAGPLASIIASPNPITLDQGASTSVSATTLDAYGNYTFAVVSFAVVNGGGSISNSGYFTAGNTAGTYTSTIKVYSGAVAAYVTVTIRSAPAASLVITPSNVNIKGGSSYQFTVTAYDSNGNIVSAAGAYWDVVGGGGTIDPTGRFTAGTIVGVYTDTIEVTLGALVAHASVSVI